MPNVWKTPPIIKVYEALGAIADKRVTITGSTATVQSSDRSKSYSVIFDISKNAIRSNDNGSYWQGYLGYPAIAVLMLLEVLPYNEKVANALKNIHWKKLNDKNKRDYEKTIQHALEVAEARGVRKETVKVLVDRVIDETRRRSFTKLGKCIPPPK